MSASSTQPLPPDSPTTGTVRRHHTISAHSRSARAAARDVISEETTDQQGIWNDDEVVDQDWVGGVGAVGEKTSLHRQASLPTRYHRGFQNQAPSSGTHTPKTVNSLAAIAGIEGDEEPWKLASYQVDDDDNASGDNQQALHQQVVDTHGLPQSNNSPLSGQYPPNVPSPPPAGSGVRRHVSLTYGAAVGGQRKASSGLKRSGTLQAPVPNHAQSSSSPDALDQAESDEYAYEPEDPSVYEDEYYLRQQQQLQQQQQQYYNNNTLGRVSPWSSQAGNEWRPTYPTGGNGNTAIDDVQRALSALELASNPNAMPQGAYGYQQNQGIVHPPRFHNTAHQQHQSTGSRGSNGGTPNTSGGGNPEKAAFDGRKTPLGQTKGYGQYAQQGDTRTSSWDQKDPNLRGRHSNSNLQYGYQQGGGASGLPSQSGSVPSVPPIPQQYLQQGAGQQTRSGLGVATPSQTTPATSAGQSPVQGFINTPIDVPSLIAAKGYNPAQFDTRPQFARYFVIKSYTEDDVHKSLKYEIWSSTDPGNKRLDKAFKDTAGRGPIYLFFSVNASGHFCGMAEMLTPVDYTRSSTVWASDKWKGVFKVRWIFVRDIPNLNLRHIKLMNTQERKPVTNSRDTQELLPDAGQDMLRIFHTHPARTSLLQDFAFYELQTMQKMQSAGSGTASPPQGAAQPTINQNYHYNMQPMMQMGMGLSSGQYASQQQAQTQAMHQSVMRHPSPGPQQQQQQGQQQSAQSQTQPPANPSGSYGGF